MTAFAYSIQRVERESRFDLLAIGLRFRETATRSWDASGEYPPQREHNIRSRPSVSRAAPSSVLLDVLALRQITEVLLQRVAACTGELDRFGHRYAPMLANELDDLHGQRR